MSNPASGGSTGRGLYLEPARTLTLVTGASGFLGSHVARLLLERGNRVRLLLRSSSSTRLVDELPGEGLERTAIESTAIERIIGDLRDRASLERAVQGVQTVFHVAADYRLWARNPREIYESNVDGTKNLLEVARASGVSRFVYTSTVATVAVQQGNTIPDETRETVLSEMIGQYKRSKWLAEREVLRAAAEGCPVVIVNPTTPVGPGDAKPTPTGRLVLDFLKGRMPAYVDTGLNFVPVEDAAAGHLLAAERGRVGERYILGAENLTLKSFLGMLSRASGRPAPRLRLPLMIALAAGYADAAVSGLLGREPRIPLEGVRMARHNMFVATEKARRELGFSPGSVEAALERSVRWYQAHGYVDARAMAAVAETRAA